MLRNNSDEGFLNFLHIKCMHMFQCYYLINLMIMIIIILNIIIIIIVIIFIIIIST